MRLLLVSNTPFLPESAGNRARIGRMLEYLDSRGWSTGMLLFGDWGMETWDLEGMRRRLAFLEVATRPRHLAARAGRAIRRALATARGGTAALDAPLDVDAWCERWMQLRTRRLVTGWAPDVVLVVYVSLSCVLEGLPAHVLRVIDAQDVMSRRDAEYRAVGMAPRWFRTGPRDEQRGLARAQLIVAIADEDARAFADMLPERDVVTVRHAVPVQPAPLDEAVAGRLLCVASDNDLNVDGMSWFFAEVWPAIRRATTSELVVFGGVCDKLRAVPDGVRLGGFVADLEPEYAGARVVLSPVRAGTGLKVKVVDALCRGRPVVATRAGARGIPMDGSTGLVVADAPADFAGAVVQLLTDDARWRLAADAATEFAERVFAPEAAFGPLSAALERHLGPRSRAAR